MKVATALPRIDINSLSHRDQLKLEALTRERYVLTALQLNELISTVNERCQ